jgi:HAD superfamily hydrolase (TIGR01509 family)
MSRMNGMPSDGRRGPRQARAVLFDLDGTLLDSFEQYRRGVTAALQDFGFGVPPALEIRETRGLPGAAVVVRLGVSVADAHAVHGRWVEHSRHLGHLSRPFPGVVSLLKELRASGHRLAIVTSRPHRSVAGTPSAVELASYVDVLVTRDDTEMGKPGPDPILHALRALRTDPQEGVYVGDASYDIDAGKRAGCVTVLVTWDETRMREPGDFSPDYVVGSVDELRHLLLRE